MHVVEYCMNINIYNTYNMIWIFYRPLKFFFLIHSLSYFKKNIHQPDISLTWLSIRLSLHHGTFWWVECFRQQVIFLIFRCDAWEAVWMIKCNNSTRGQYQPRVWNALLGVREKIWTKWLSSYLVSSYQKWKGTIINPATWSCYFIVHLYYILYIMPHPSTA